VSKLENLTEESSTCPYALLNDQPVSDSQGDFLDTRQIAKGISSLLISSRRSSPFVLTIDAGWGMGKSTLLRQVEACLPDETNMVKVHFNAWTAQGDNALEGLIKTVLGELDPSTVRRWVRRIARQQRTMLIARIGSSLIARFFGATRLIDELWHQLGGDSRSRNEMRDLIRGMLAEWLAQNGQVGPGRMLAVFIDDLDRCSEEAVVKICEAVKLYLDVPGLIFVIACDLSVLARSVSTSARGGALEGRMYLEKIIQVVYRVPLPEAEQVMRLIAGYAEQSGTTRLIDENVAQILAEGSGRNPRKIKRIINSFVLEYQLDPAWREPPLGSEQLVIAVLLQHLYAPFYEFLLREESGEDPIGLFLDFVAVEERSVEPPRDDLNDPWWGAMQRIFQAHRLVLKNSPDDVDREIERIEKILPETFRLFVRDNGCVTLLRRIGDGDLRRSFRAQLIHRPLATARVAGVSSDTTPMGVISETHRVDQEQPSISLADAVQFAHDEGFGYGDAVARDAPALWLEAVLARKPRMPSDLEARLLQASALPIDSLLHDEVRHALRQGFWDALEKSRGRETPRWEAPKVSDTRRSPPWESLQASGGNDPENIT
jgi:hypothetical protein